MLIVHSQGPSGDGSGDGSGQYIAQEQGGVKPQIQHITPRPVSSNIGLLFCSEETLSLLLMSLAAVFWALVVAKPQLTYILG